ncbi:MAG: hypothetical protein R3C14_41790 [Caldilineaceae bacterium]
MQFEFLKVGWLFLPIVIRLFGSQYPTLEIDDNFYIQAQVSLLEGHFCDSNTGLVMGEAGGNYNGFVIGANCGSGNYVAFLDSGSVKFETPVGGDTLLHVSSPTRTLGLEASKGLYTFYIDGKATESFPIEQSYGNQVGLLAWDSGAYGPNTTIAFDNVTVRDKK